MAKLEGNDGGGYNRYYGGSSFELEGLLRKNEEPANFRLGDLIAEIPKRDFIPVQTIFSVPLLSFFSAALYGIVGLVMGFANKAVLQVWPYSNSFLTAQMAASVVIVYALKLTGLIQMRSPDLKSMRSLAYVVFFYNANVAFALAAVQALSIPVYHVLKRLTPAFILFLKLILGESMPPLQITLSVLTVVAGCIFAGMGDLSFDLTGYSMALISCVLQGTYLILVEKSGSEKAGFSSNELLLYNAIMSFPVLLCFILLTGEIHSSVPALLKAFADGYGWLIVSSLIMASLLNYALFFCTIMNSALTTTIVAIFRSVIGTVLGFFLLGGVKATALVVIGVAINTVGGVWYTVVRFRMKHTPAVRLETPPAPL